MSLSELIRRHLTTPYPWDCELPRSLQHFAEKRLLQNRRLDFRTYGTARMLRGDSSAARCQIAEVPLGKSSRRQPALVELLPRDLQESYRQHGLRFLAEDELRASCVLGTLSAACEQFVSLDNSLLSSVRELVRVVHPLRSQSDDYDCSYSHPELPFSIFVSSPLVARRDAAARVAESIIHETLHLQLSIIERVEPLIRPAGPGLALYSPWKGEKRPPRGVLHGIYVFALLRQFWRGICQYSLETQQLRIAAGRAEEIGRQIGEVAGFQHSDDLTAAGRKLVEHLMSLSTARIRTCWPSSLI